MTEKKICLCQEDFKDFPIGEFPFDEEHSATGEYHFITEPGYRGNWYDPVCNYSYRGHGPSWIITEWDGVHYMESMRIEKNHPHRMFPTLETGEPEWKNYTVSVKMRRLSGKGTAGLFFCGQNSLNGLVFGLNERGEAELSYRHKEAVTVLASCPYGQDPDRLLELSVDCEGSSVTCSIDGATVLTAETDIANQGGRVGITADCPTKFTEFRVAVSEEEAERIQLRITKIQEQELAEQRKHPEMKLWKRLDLRNFGTSRQIRFGHLTGGDTWYVVLAQMQRRVSGDAYGFISCLTAMDLNGQVLWQLGEPSKNSAVLGKVSADMPFQVYDIDGDGKDEVIVGRNFEIQILDGATGAVRRSAPTPLSTEPDESIISIPYNTYAFDRINPDGIRICNFRGKKRPADILIKDRYCRVYALDENLKLLWKYQSRKNTGHCPLPLDINEDGKDEILVGYTMLSAEGKELWTYPIENDHTDEIVPGKFRGDDKLYFACVSGTEGFFVGDAEGRIVFRDRIGHAQRVSVAKYCEDREDFQLAVVNFWGHQGIIYLYDTDGNTLWEMENTANGNLLTPVNWDGSGRELILTNADPQTGGLLTGAGVRAVRFPDDGHPTLCCEAIDLTGDERDELVCWDYHWMYIYTQADGEQPQTYHPVKFPQYNASNYRGEYAYPDASYLK